MISAAQVRKALVLLGWTPSKLATAALVTFDAVVMAQDDVSIRFSGGLQLGGIQRALEAAGVEFIPENDGGARVRLRRSEP